MNRMFFVLGLLVLPQLGGCALVQFSKRVEPPMVDVMRVALAEQSEEGVVVHAMIRVQNPNDVPLPLVASEYTVLLDPNHSFTFDDKLQQMLAAKGIQELRLSAAFATKGQAVAEATYHIRGLVRYEPPGQIRRILTDSGIPLPAVAYSETGQLAP